MHLNKITFSLVVYHFSSFFAMAGDAPLNNNCTIDSSVHNINHGTVILTGRDDYLSSRFSVLVRCKEDQKVVLDVYTIDNNELVTNNKLSVLNAGDQPGTVSNDSYKRDYDNSHSYSLPVTLTTFTNRKQASIDIEILSFLNGDYKEETNFSIDTKMRLAPSFESNID